MAVQLPLGGAYAPPRLQTLPVQERPISRLAMVGPGAVSNYELLAAVLRGSRQLEKAVHVLAGFDDDLTALSRATVGQLIRQGLSKQAAASIVAAFELGRRAIAPQDRPQVKSPAEAARLLMSRMSHLEQEHFQVLFLDTRNRVLGSELLYKGSLNQSQIRVGEVFREAIRRNCAAIIVAHNHPSGDPTPSPEDVAVTRDLVAAGKLLGIEVLDHLIIGQGRWESLRERGIGFADE